jgi:2,3-bisphosphoglycerate-dependent phosphoglycerate mutase
MSESLQDTMERTLPLLMKRIIPDIKLGKTVLVVAHANSLRGKHEIDSFL